MTVFTWTGTPYVRDQTSKRVPEIAAIRKSMALGYRTMRRDNPPLARLFWRHARRCEELTRQSLADRLFSDDARAGLAELLR